MRNNKIPRSANAKYHYSYLFFYKINKGDLPSFSRHCDMATGHGGVGSEFKFPSTEGGSVNKENPQQTFPVVVVVWIPIRVLPVKIINPKNDHSHVKTK